MKKKYYYLFIIIFYTSVYFAQDVITKKSGEDIKAKVLEVTTTEIKFNKFDMPNSPIFSLLKSDVLIIRYQNGTKDIFNNEIIITKPIIETIIVAEKKVEHPKEISYEKEVISHKIKYGIKGGLNYSSIKSDFFQDLRPIVSYNIGAFLQIRIDKNFIFQPEIQFSAQGADYKNVYQVYDSQYIYEQRLLLNYINLPLLLNFEINKNICFYSGPQLGFLAFATDNSRNVRDDFKSIDFAADFGTNIIFNDFVIDFRYNLGLSSVFPTKTSSTFQTKNNIIQLTFGYKFK